MLLLYTLQLLHVIFGAHTKRDLINDTQCLAFSGANRKCFSDVVRSLGS